MAVTEALRRHGVGRALLTEIARRAQDAGRAFLALAPRKVTMRPTARRSSKPAGSRRSSPTDQALPGDARLCKFSPRGARLLSKAAE
jgi:GNAT superfamily N-acetyltransferase